MKLWNGVAFFPGRPQIDSVTANASGSWGLLKGGASWFQFQWPSDWNNVNIATTELFPLVVTTAISGIKWKCGSVLFRSDNQAVVAALCLFSQ